MESMLTPLERDSEVVVEKLNVAVSPALTGADAGVQLEFSFHTEEGGFAFQTASRATAAPGIATSNKKRALSVTNKDAASALLRIR